MSPIVRWAFNVSKWEPSEKELMLASSCLQDDEKTKINGYVYKKDAKATLVGRLMIRKFITESTGLPYKSIKLLKNIYNKPIYDISDSKFPVVSFNVSHHGSYTVLAGEIGSVNIGVDIMKLEYTGGKSLEEFFRVMNQNFTVAEWNQITGTSQTTELEKISNFCRNWALKESYLKAIGVGLMANISHISFNINSKLLPNGVITDTDLFIRNIKQSWIFEESLLDPIHCVVVAYEKKHEKLNEYSNLFKIVTSTELLVGTEPFQKEDIQFCDKFFLKS